MHIHGHHCFIEIIIYVANGISVVISQMASSTSLFIQQTFPKLTVKPSTAAEHVIFPIQGTQDSGLNRNAAVSFRYLATDATKYIHRM